MSENDLKTIPKRSQTCLKMILSDHMIISISISMPININIKININVNINANINQ
jgi:hypothetical protein